MKRFDLDNIFNDSSIIDSQSLNICTTTKALFFAGKTPFSEYFRASYNLPEADYMKAAEELRKHALKIKRYFDACPYIKIKSDMQTIDFNAYSKLYDEFEIGSSMFLYPYAVFLFEFEHNFKTKRECEKMVYQMNSIVLKGAYLDFFKYEPVKTFCRVNLDTGRYMPLLWGPEFRQLAGKRIRRGLHTEARSTSENLFKFFCDDRH